MNHAAFIIIALIVAAGCVPAEEANTTPTTIRTSYEYWPGAYWVDIADQKGWFQEAGLNVELAFDANEDFAASEQAVVDGDLDTVQFVFFDMIKYIAEGYDLVTVVATDQSFGGDQIIARTDIKTVADLKGKKVGVNQDSFQEFLLTTILERNKLTLNDITIVQAIGEDTDLFINGDIDALVTWEPHATTAKKEGDGHIIFDTSEIPGLITDGITFHRTFVDSHPNDVQAYVNVWHKTTEFIKQQPDEAFGIIARKYNVTPGEVQAFAQQDKILDLRDNTIAFAYAPGFQSLHGTARQINNFMIDKGITDTQLDSITFIDAQFIRAIT